MADNTNTPMSSTLQKSANTILQSVVIALLIWVGTSINANNEKIVSIQKDVEAIQRNQNDISKQIDKMVTKEVFDMQIQNLNSRDIELDERIKKIEK